MVTFFQLGATNAWRNLARSTLAILSMSLAAAFLTNAVSLSRGYPNMYMWNFRTVLGGEIIVYDTQFIGEIPEGESTWSYQKLGSNPLSDLDIFYPELASRGFLSENAEITPLNADLQKDLASLKGIAAVYPRYQLPAETVVDAHTVRSTPLRGRDFNLDMGLAASPEKLIVDGRWLTEEDEGQLVAVVAGHISKPNGQRGLHTGKKVTVQVPRIYRLGSEIGLDYEDALSFDFEVVGIIDVPTRELDTPVVSSSGEQMQITASLFWKLDEIQIPLSTWQMIWEQVADQSYLPRELMLQVEDISYIEDTMLVLKEYFSNLSFVHVPDLIDKAMSQLLIEDLSGIPETALASLHEMSDYREQSVMPLDLRAPLSVLIFLNAALVIASNLLIMINERKTEIGILKAVGALKREIVQMALAEAVLIASLGAIGGFLFIRLPATLNQLTNRIALSSLLWSIGRDFLLVLAVALLAALLFGLLPALRMAGLSVNEVLRNE